MHVAQGVYGDTKPPHLAVSQLVVGVQAGKGWVVKIGAQAGLAAAQQELVSLVGCLSRTESRYLPASPKPFPVHGRVGAAGKGILPRRTQAVR